MWHCAARQVGSDERGVQCPLISGAAYLDGVGSKAYAVLAFVVLDQPEVLQGTDGVFGGDAADV